MASSTSPTAGSRIRDADATRADLLRAARRRFVVLGFERTTTRDIAADAGANVSLITRYFGSKRGLFEAVLNESAELIEDRGPALGESMVEAFLDGLEPDAWPEFGHQHPLVLLLRETGEEEVEELRREVLRQSISTIARRLQADVAAGRTTIDPATVQLRAELLFALFSGITTLRTALRDEPLATADREVLREVLERAGGGLLGRPAD